METGKICQVIFWLAVTARHVAFASDSNELCQKEQTLERLMKLEYKVKELDREMVKTNAGLIGLLDVLNRRIEEIASGKGNTDGKGAEVVAFSSYNPVSNSPKTGSTIVFGNTQLNEGNAYSTTTGEFTVPDGGVYEFNAHICNGGGKFIVYAINRNGNETLALSTQWDDTGSCGSVNALARLNAGDKVFLKCDYCDAGVQFYENVHRRNTFSGVLIH